MADNFTTVPKVVNARLDSQSYIDSISLIVDKFKLNEDQEKKMISIGRSVILKETSISDLLEKFKTELNLDDQMAKEITIDFIGYQLLPIQDYLGDVTDQLQKMGGNINDYLVKADQILQPENLYWEDVIEVWGRANFNIDEVGPETQKNYFNISISYLLNEIKSDDLTSAMAAKLSDGGLGVTVEQAEIIAEWTQNLIDSGGLGLDDFKKLDQIRAQILGPETPSIIVARQVDMTESNSVLANDLLGQMKKFIAQSEVGLTMDQAIGFNNKHGYDEVKTKFYDAINNKDRLEFISNLATMMSSGQLKELFTNDERYVKFWRNRILNDKGLEGVRKFDENPLRPEQFGSFIRHVIEERFEVPTEDAALWGVFFSSLAHRAGDTYYDRLAYGDLTDQKFKWNF